MFHSLRFSTSVGRYSPAQNSQPGMCTEKHFGGGLISKKINIFIANKKYIVSSSSNVIIKVFDIKFYKKIVQIGKSFNETFFKPFKSREIKLYMYIYIYLIIIVI